jgi:hypothetical protein
LCCYAAQGSLHQAAPRLFVEGHGYCVTPHHAPLSALRVQLSQYVEAISSRNLAADPEAMRLFGKACRAAPLEYPGPVPSPPGSVQESVTFGSLLDTPRGPGVSPASATVTPSQSPAVPLGQPASGAFRSSQSTPMSVDLSVSGSGSPGFLCPDPLFTRPLSFDTVPGGGSGARSRGPLFAAMGQYDNGPASWHGTTRGALCLLTMGLLWRLELAQLGLCCLPTTLGLGETLMGFLCWGRLPRERPPTLGLCLWPCSRLLVF